MIFRRPSATRAVDAFEQALDAREPGRAGQAFDDLGRALARAGAKERAAAGPRLAALIDRLSPEPGAALAVLVGACVEGGADPLACAGPVLAGLRAALTHAVAFAEHWPQDAEEDLQAPGEEIPDEVLALLGDGPEPFLRAASWASLPGWEQAATAVLIHPEVRRSLTDRDELPGLTARLAGFLGETTCLTAALSLLDDEPLLVLDRVGGAGFRLRMSGIADNFQLHTLLAGVLIGGGHLPGTAPSPDAVAAYLGTGRSDRRPAVTGSFNLVAADGSWIWNEGTPRDIPVVDGIRLLVLDPPSYPRTWAAGAMFPAMRAELVLEEVLAPQEAARHLAAVRPATSYGG
ncbi:hypothetical protein [Kitasatospora sp. NPDC094015]|uniref:hypothetical protein n=1 Tax=Kitasatospora sp. NPDC094015 TaxID=3155205 RepID=UPI00331D372E